MSHPDAATGIARQRLCHPRRGRQNWPVGEVAVARGDSSDVCQRATGPAKIAQARGIAIVMGIEVNPEVDDDRRLRAAGPKCGERIATSVEVKARSGRRRV